MRITAKNKFRTLVILLLISAVTFSAALWSVLRTRDGAREAYADTQAQDIINTINNAEPWGNVSTVTVGSGAGDNGVVVTVGSSDAAGGIALKTGAQAVVNETMPSAQNELEGKEVYSLVVFDVPVTVQSEAKLTLNADVVFRAGVTVYGTLEINGMAFNQGGMVVSNTLNSYSEIRSEGVIVNGSLNNDGARGGTIHVSGSSALTVNAGGALFLKADKNNALGISGTIANNGSVIYDSAANEPAAAGAQAAEFISEIDRVADNGTYIFYPSTGDGAALSLKNGGTRSWSRVTLLSFGRTTLKNSVNSAYYTLTNVSLGGSASGDITQGANELIFDGGAKWTQGGGNDNYDLYFLTGTDSATRAEYYNVGVYSESDPLVRVSGGLKMYGGVKITRHETRAGTGVGGGVKVPNGAALNLFGGEISYNAVTQISTEQNIGGAGVYCAGTLTMKGGKITRNANASIGFRSASAAGVAVNGNGSSLVLEGGEISFNCGATGDAFTNHLGADGGGVQGNTKAKIFMNGGSISNNWTGGYGGGIALWDAEFRMNGGEISGNEAAWGGGVNANGAIGEPSAVYIANGTISDNRAAAHSFNGNTSQGGYGGGLCVGTGTQQTNSSAVISGGVISGNTAVYGGGLAVYTINSVGYNTLTMTGGTVTGNCAERGISENGNGVYVYCVSNAFTQSEGMLRLSGNASVDTSNNVSFDFGIIPVYIFSGSLYSCDGGFWNTHTEHAVFYYDGALYINQESGYRRKLENGTFTPDDYMSLRANASQSRPVADRNHRPLVGDSAFDTNDAVGTYFLSGIEYEARYSGMTAPITVNEEFEGTQLASLVYLGTDTETSLWQDFDIISYSKNVTVNRDKFLLDSKTYTLAEKGSALQIAAAAQDAADSVAYNEKRGYYSSLAEAVAEAQSGDVIQILRSATLEKTIVVDKDITIEPDGDFTLYIKSGFETNGAINPALFRVENGATLALGGKNTLAVSGNTSEENIPLVTVINGSYVQKDGVTLTGASVTGGDAIHSVQTDASAIYLASSNASAVVEGGVIRSNRGGLGAVYVGDGASLTLSGGAIGGALSTDRNVDKNGLEYGVYVTGRGKVTLNGAVALHDAINLSAKGASVTAGGSYENALAEDGKIRLTYSGAFDADDAVVNILNTYAGDADTALSDFALYRMDDSLYALRLRGSADGESKDALVVQKAVRYIFDFRYQNGFGDDTPISGMKYLDGNAELKETALKALIDSLNGTVFANDGRIRSRGQTLVVYVFSGSESFSLSSLKEFAQKTGWTLSAWHRGSKDSVLSAIGDSASLSYTNSSAPIELRSVWTPNRFHIAFDSNYTGLGSGAQPSLIEGAMNPLTVDYSVLGNDETANLTINNYTAVGFEFTGWGLTGGAGAAVTFENGIALTAADWNTMIGGVIGVEHGAENGEAGYVEYSVTLYAVWQNIFSGGVGTSENPFEIGKLRDLYILEATAMGMRGSSDDGVSVSEAYYNTHNEDGSAAAYAAENYAGYYFELTDNLSGFKGVIGRTSGKDTTAALQDAEITASLPQSVSAGNDGMTENGMPFAGTFSGGGHSIGLAINKHQVTGGEYENAKQAAGGTLTWENGDETLLGAGLFGYTVGATISDLTLTGSVHGYSHVGGLVGYAVNSAISSIYNKAAVTSGGHDVGGIVGTYFVTDERGMQYVVTNVVNGGVVSYAPRLDDKTTTLSTQEGWSETQKLSDVQGIRFGGVVGYGIALRLTGGYNTGSVAGRYAVGGVAGILHSLNNNTTSDTALTNVFNTGAVTATAGLFAAVHSQGGVSAEAVNAYVGGLVGRAVGASAVDTAFNSGRVTASWMGVKNTSGEYVYVDLSATAPSAGSEYIGARGAGGIVGFTSYDKSATEGDLKSIANAYNTGTVSAWAGVGGIAGYFAYSTVSRAYNGGSVLANGFHFEGGEQVRGGMRMPDGSYHAFLGSLVGTGIGSSLSDVYYNTDKRYGNFTDETLRQIGDYEYTAETLGFAESTFSAERGRTASQMSVISSNNRPSGFGTDFSGTYWSFLYYADPTAGEGQAEEGQTGQTYHYPQLNAFAGETNIVTIGGQSFHLGGHSKNSTLVTVPNDDGEEDKPITDADRVRISYSLGGGAFTFAGSDGGGSFFAEKTCRYKLTEGSWQTEVGYKIGGGEEHEELAQLEQPDDPARVGYRFTGWYSDAACREMFSFGSIPASDKTVYAGWEAVSYTFVYEEFSSRGASFVGEYDATFSILDAGTKEKLPIAGDVIRRGYRLSGWLCNNKAVDGYQVFAPGSGDPYIEFYSGGIPVETVSFNAVVNRQLYLTAVWEPTPYTIAYGGLSADKFADGAAATLNGAKESYTIADAITFKIPQKKGYTFDGWLLVSLDGKTATGDFDSVNKEHYAIGDILTGIVSGTVGDVVLEAQWSRNDVTLYLDARGGTIEQYADYKLSLDLSGRYYISVPYYSSGNDALAFLFGEDGAFHVTATLPEGAGRQFSGWYTVVDPSGDDSPIAKDFTVTGDASGTGSQTIYAGYQTAAYAIAVSLGEYADSVDPDMEDMLETAGFRWNGDLERAEEFTLAGVLHGSSASDALALLASAINVTDGYNLLGWVTDSGGSAPVYNVTSDLTITAQYAQKQVTVNFVGLNGELLGSVAIGQNSAIGKENETYNNTIKARAENYFGYDFKGWYYTDASGVRQDFKLTDTVSASMVVYAGLQAKAVAAQVILVMGDTNERIPLEGYAYSFGATFGRFPALGDMLNELSEQDRAKFLGHEISGWSVGGAAVGVNTVITREMVEGDGTLTIELYAELTKATYTISFNANGGSFSGVAPVGEYRFGDDASVQYRAGSSAWKEGLPVPTRAGHTLAWNVYDADGTRLGDASVADAAELITLLNKAGCAGNITLIAEWTAEKYTVWFSANGGAFALPEDAIDGIKFYAADQTTEVTAENQSQNPAVYFTMTVQYGTVPNPPVSLDAPQRNGHIFMGWRDFGNAILTVVTSDEQYSKVSPIQALWTEGRYSVAFVTNGGTALSDITEIVYGADLSALLADRIPARAGCAFAGWYYDSGLTECVGDSDTMPSKDIVLYAKWVVNSYTLTLNIAIDGGTVDAKTIAGALRLAEEAVSVAPVWGGYKVTITVPYETNLSALNTIAFGDYRLSGTWRQGDADVLLTAMPAGDYEVSGTFAAPAQGVAVIFCLTEDTVYYRMTVSSGKTVPEPPAPARTGYSFGGWFTAEGEAFDFEMPITGETKLYAHWEALEYTVTLRGEGIDHEPIEVAYGTALTWGTGGPLPVPVRGGYTFEGWYLDADFAVSVGTMPAYDLTLYAKWEATEYSIVFQWGLKGTDTVTVSGGYNGALNLSSVGGAVPHYTFVWQVTADGKEPIGVALDDFRTMPNLLEQYADYTFVVGGRVSITVQAKYTAIGYEIMLEGADSLCVTVESAGRRRFTELGGKTGCTFAGWKLSADDTAYISYEVDVSDGEWGVRLYRDADSTDGRFVSFAEGFPLYLTAAYTANSYTVAFDPNDGEGGMTSQEFKYGTAQNLKPNAFKRVGYTFAGWAVRSDAAEIAFADGASVTNLMTENGGKITFYAVWRANTYTVTFNPNHESGAFEKVAYRYGDKVELIADPVRDGYDFAGWHCNGELWGSDMTMPAENITLVAMWTLKSFTVRFSVGDGAAGAADQTIYFGFTATEPTDPVRSGYIFGGWMLDGNGYDFGTPVKNNLTLTAKWLPRTYSIDYVLGGGVNADGNPYFYDIESGTIVLADPVREGFVFLGWYDAEQNGSRVTEITAGSTGRIALYARWQANVYTVDFVLNGGAMEIAEQTVVAGGTVAFEEPTRENYLFMGWFTDAACTQRYGFSTPVTGDLTLYAKWRLSVISGTASDGTLVTITSNEGFDDGTDIRFAEVTDEETLSEAAGSLAGNMTLARLFDIELIAADGMPVSIDEPLSVGISVQGLAAAVGRYAVVYVPDGGGTIEEIATHIGDDGRMYFFVEHFSFYAVVDVLGIAPTGGFAWWWILVAVAGCALFAGILVLLARSMRRYELNYVNGGVPSRKLRESALVDLPLPEREEEVFEGWYYDETFRDRATLTSMPKQNLILFAKWRKMTEAERAARDRARAGSAAAQGFREADPKWERRRRENPLNEIKEDE